MSLIVCPLRLLQTVCETRPSRRISLPAPGHVVPSLEGPDAVGRHEIACESQPFEIAARW